MTNSDGMTVTARGGQRGNTDNGWNGGSGWSGGGGGGYNGGFNGGDGQDGTRRSGGSGQQTALPTVLGVTIVPGAGGKSCSNCHGGGGGGIIINGEGTRDDDGEAQGYGTGGRVVHQH